MLEPSSRLWQWIDITGTPERAVPDGYYWLTVATNWDEAGREETSPENDYANNEVRGLLHTYEPPSTLLNHQHHPTTAPF